jgi:hypothetical protein
MSYDPSHRRPPRQERWPNATPQEGWPAYQDGEQAWAEAGAFAGARSGRPGVNGHGDTWGGYGPGYDTSGGYTETRDRYAPARDSFDGGYGGTTDEYAEPDPVTRSGPLLIAPDTIGERGWRPDRDESTGRGQDRSGPVIGAVMGFLAAAVAIGVSTFAAAFVRPQASPIIAVGGAFVDRTPSALKNFAVQHFGENDKTVLLGGMYVMIAVIAMAIGFLARRNATIGVAGIAAFGLFGAFVAITRPEARVTDVMPSVIGGVAGIAAFLWLARAAAPIVPARAPARASSLRHAHPSGHRRAR